ncbi:hypothetical protein OsJ_30995 [Oryza sativa Japonica Group]|uniref:Reverse transcriptase zinc-binding domain-containing protein n=1 Tax=Oryza sativa subsp. japonica TaxID=39947 RepID=B9G7X9_ORYSJ|nr:hypothetical protein OsJ_30995 [Oryza sativa Japonica Group]
MEDLPITYLGLPLSIRNPTKAELQPIMDRMAKKVAGWKPKLLSPDGRLCLIKSVLMAIPVHLLSVVQLPRWVIKDIERRCRGFLWKGQEEISGGHCLVAWREICMPIGNGGLGIKDIDSFGKALRLKWEFKRQEQRDRPWTMANWESEKDVGDLFNSLAIHILGDGSHTDFCRGNWLPRGGSIANNCPTLFSFVSRTKLMVAQGLISHRWVRDLQGSLSSRALAEYLSLWDELQSVAVQEGVRDSVVWRFAANGVFSVSSAYDLFFLTSTKCPFGEAIWKTKAPARVRFFLWLAAKGRCLTADNLSKRGWPHNPDCLLCLSAPENCKHLCTSCTYTNRVWSLLRTWLGFGFDLPGRSGEELAVWWQRARSCCRPSYRDAFDSFFMLVCWRIWKERNAQVFDQKEKTVESLVADIKEDVMVWRAAGIFQFSEE